VLWLFGTMNRYEDGGGHSGYNGPTKQKFTNVK
jgi:hypothetical protein